MGLCSSNQHEVNVGDSACIDQIMRDEALREARIPKVLLLGTGESGKSTVFKQMVKLYGNGLVSGDSKQYYHAIMRNIVESIYELCIQSEHLIGRKDIPPNATQILPENVPYRDYVYTVGRVASEVDSEMIIAVENLWNDPGIQATFENRNLFQLYDSAAYFLSRVRIVSSKDYTITDEDVLMARVRTTGMIEKLFSMGDNFKLRLVDVGGQRSERKKWIRWFEGVTAVVFVTAISEYDQSCFEDESTNRMDESLSVFKETANSEWFAESSIILFLNKRDLFEDKLQKSPLKDRFPEYQPLDEPASALAFVKDKFLSLVKNKERSIFVHHTTATDSDMMSNVLDAVKQTLLKRALQHASLL